MISPWLRGWCGRRWYHGAWNAVVIAGFGILLHHILQGGLHLLLRDGADHQAILHRGVQAGANILRFDLVEPRLHEIFVRHAGADAVGDAGLPQDANLGGA